MRIDALTVTLRPRTSWEAIELGMALTRRYAKVIWASWLAFTFPVLLLAHGVGWALHRWWIAGLLMWWLKPLFDRVPLYVLSRATFGDIPSLRQTLLAQRRWSGRWMWSYLTVRRLGPVRALYLPVDLLEGSTAERARLRRQEVGSSIYGISFLMTLMCCLFSVVLQVGLVGAALLFIPNVYVSEVFQHASAVLKASPWWLLIIIINVTYWLVMSLIEPFYVGAGFGLYINRRTQLEAWDIELVFRRLRTRLTQAASLLICLLTLALAIAPTSARAYAKTQSTTTEPTDMQQIFGEQKADGAMGLLINRPQDLNLADILEQLRPDCRGGQRTLQSIRLRQNHGFRPGQGHRVDEEVGLLSLLGAIVLEPVGKRLVLKRISAAKIGRASCRERV